MQQKDKWQVNKVTRRLCCAPLKSNRIKVWHPHYTLHKNFLSLSLNLNNYWFPVSDGRVWAQGWMWLQQLAGAVIVLCYTILHCHNVSGPYREVVTRKLTDMYWHNPDSGHTSSGPNHRISGYYFSSSAILNRTIPLFSTKTLYRLFSHNKRPPGHPPISNHTRAHQTNINTSFESNNVKLLSENLTFSVNWPSADHLTQAYAPIKIWAKKKLSDGRINQIQISGSELF